MSCFQVLPDLLTKKAKLRADAWGTVFRANWKFAEKEQMSGNLNIQ